MRIGAAVIATLLAGCSQSNQVTASYLNAADSLGIHALYPPTEDLRLGDVFLAETFTCSGDEQPGLQNAVFFARPAPGAVDSAYEAFQATDWRQPTIPVQDLANGSGPSSAGAYPGGSSAGAANQTVIPDRTPGEPLITELPAAALPSFEFATAGAAGASGGGRASAIHFLGQIGYNKQSVVHLDYSGVTIARLPFETMKNIFVDPKLYGRNLGESARVALRSIDLPLEQFASKKCPDTMFSSHPLFVIPTVIYYARSIDYSTDQSSALGAALAAAIKQSASLSNAAGPSPSPLRQAAKSGAPNSQLATAVQNLNQIFQPLAAPGVTLHAGIGASGEVVLNATFDRPLAVAYSAPILLTPAEFGTGSITQGDFLVSGGVRTNPKNLTMDVTKRISFSVLRGLPRPDPTAGRAGQ